MDRHDGGAAWPCSNGGAAGVEQRGMTLRDWFAGQALDAVVANNTMLNELDRTAPAAVMSAKVARMSYALADAMLAERSK